jgi:hypothetical protein
MARKNGSPNYLAFEYDKEVVVTLKEDRGRLSENDYGEFFARNFADGRFTCASPDLERRLLDVGAKAGSVVSITKERYGRSAVWVVKLLGASQNHQNGHANGVDHAWNDLPAEKYAPSPADGDLVAKLAESVAMVEASKVSPAISKSTCQQTQVDDLLTRCLIAAIDSAKAAQSHASAIGFPLVFGPDQVEALAACLYIQSSKQTNINLMHRNEELRNGRAR